MLMQTEAAQTGASGDISQNLRVSIVVINHNYARFLKTAIDSALGQTVAAYEIIVVDDGSSDNSREVIATYNHAVVPVLVEQQGHVAAANVGFAHVRGDVCIFLDADDYLYDTCIEKVQVAWRGDCVKVQYRLDTVDADGQDKAMPFPNFPADMTPAAARDLAIRYGAYPWTVSTGNAFNVKYLAQLMPIDNHVIFKSPDGFLNKMAPLFGDVLTLDVVLGAYRVHGKNAWAQSAGEIRSAPLVKAVRFDQALHLEFEKIAKMRGVDVTPFGRLVLPQAIEYRLLGLRLTGAEYPITGDSRFGLLQRGVRGAMTAPNMSPAGRVFWSSWLFALAVLPKPMVIKLFGAARNQSDRTAISKLLVRLSRSRKPRVVPQ